jgi:hypothetical protein
MYQLGQERPFEQFDRTAGLSALPPSVESAAKVRFEPLADMDGNHSEVS